MSDASCMHQCFVIEWVKVTYVVGHGVIGRELQTAQTFFESTYDVLGQSRGGVLQKTHFVHCNPGCPVVGDGLRWSAARTYEHDFGGWISV